MFYIFFTIFVRDFQKLSSTIDKHNLFYAVTTIKISNLKRIKKNLINLGLNH